MQKIKLKLLLTQSEHVSGTSLVTPVLIPNLLRLETKPAAMATMIANALDRDLMKKGNFHALLTYFTTYEPVAESIDVQLEASPEQLYPALNFSFHFFCFPVHSGHWLGFVPELELQSAGNSREALIENMRENILLEFMRMKRLHAVPLLIETQWYSEVNIHSLPIHAPIYSLPELAEIARAEEEDVLPRIAQPLIATENEVFGLEKEAEQIRTAMQGAHKSSVLVVGGSGTGKTALIRELARSIIRSSTRPLCIWELSAAQLLNKLSALGSWEEYLGLVCRELRKTGDILYLTNFSELFEVGQYEGNSMSMADYLRDYLSREEIILISECTPEQSAQIDLRAPGYLGLFTVVQITEKSPETLQEIVRLRTLQLAEQNGSIVTDAAIAESLRLQRWFTPYSGLPGKTIRFLQGILSEKEQHDIRIVEEADVYQRFCQETGLPPFMIDAAIPLEYEEVKAFFQRNIYGQVPAIRTLLDLLVSIKAAVIKRGKPLASLLFVGPTGVGKTEMAKVLAHFLFGNRERMIRFDMSEYTDMQGILRLTGDLSSSEGLLTAVVRQNPFSVILFDELEKVHPAFYDLLLQILGEGRLTDSRGRVADFCSTIIIMTSNIGAREYQTEGIGFTDYGDKKAEAVNHFIRAVQDHFRPELFNRLDRIIPFMPLEKPVIRRIVDRELTLFLNREGLRSRPVSLAVSESARRYLAEKGYHPRYGARHLQRTLHEQLAVPLARQLNAFAFSDRLIIEVGIEEETLKMDIRDNPEPCLAEQKIAGSDELSPPELAQDLSEQRRRMDSIRNGQCYLQLTSRLDELEAKLTKLKRKNTEAVFWKNPTNQQVYLAYGDLVRKFEVAMAEIQEMELTGLELLAEMPIDAAGLYADFTRWSAPIPALEREMLTLQYPDFNRCAIGIFGNPQHLFSLAELYLDFAKNQGLEGSATTVWFNQETRQYEREAYEKRRHTAAFILCGVILQLEGELASLRFQGEDGYHVWAEGRNAPRSYFVSVDQDVSTPFQVPAGVHRMSFFDGKKSRRIYDTRGELQDLQYGIFISDGKLADHLAEILTASYQDQVEAYLIR